MWKLLICPQLVAGTTALSWRCDTNYITNPAPQFGRTLRPNCNDSGGQLSWPLIEMQSGRGR